MKIIDDDTVVANARTLLEQGCNDETILTRLRQGGASVTQCIRAIMDARQLTLAEAKRLVHFSRAWREEKEDHEAFHDKAEDAARRLGGGEV